VKVDLDFRFCQEKEKKMSAFASCLSLCIELERYTDAFVYTERHFFGKRSHCEHLDADIDVDLLVEQVRVVSTSWLTSLRALLRNLYERIGFNEWYLDKLSQGEHVQVDKNNSDDDDDDDNDYGVPVAPFQFVKRYYKDSMEKLVARCARICAIAEHLYEEAVHFEKFSAAVAAKTLVADCWRYQCEWQLCWLNDDTSDEVDDEKMIDSEEPGHRLAATALEAYALALAIADEHDIDCADAPRLRAAMGLASVCGDLLRDYERTVRHIDEHVERARSSQNAALLERNQEVIDDLLKNRALYDSHRTKSSSSSSSASASSSSASALFECPICMDDEVPADEMAKAFECCGYRLCTACLLGTLKGKVDGDDYLVCMADACTHVIDADEVAERVDGDASLAERYRAIYKFKMGGGNMYEPGDGRQLPSIGVVAKMSGYTHLRDVRVASETDYFHYECLGDADTAWGCAYRCLQMIANNLALRHEGTTFRAVGAEPHALDETGRWSAVPALREIQVLLNDIASTLPSGTKYGIKKWPKVGSHSWIEPAEVLVFLEHFKFSGTYVARYTPRGDRKFARIAGQLREHFAQHRTPVMIDDSIKAYCLLGVAEQTDKSGESTAIALRFDPHVQQYPRPKASSTHGVQWMPLKAIFKSRSPWMLLFAHAEPTIR
jgi:Peptidase family C78